MIFENWYQKIHDQAYEAGYNAKAVEDHEAQNQRLQDMLKYGKELGKHEGFIEGYKVGYSKGEQDERARIGEIDLDEVMEEVADEYKGFHGLVNERGFVDDVSSALEEVTA